MQNIFFKQGCTREDLHNGYVLEYMLVCLFSFDTPHGFYGRVSEVRPFRLSTAIRAFT